MEITLERSTGSIEKAQVVLADDRVLHGLHEGWRFNFEKHKRASCTKVFFIATYSEPSVIEGCIALRSIPNEDLYMAYVEIAPHNLKPERRFTNVAGCLIAFGCRESFKLKGDQKGFLAFNAVGLNDERTEQLIQHYQEKYGATRIKGTSFLFITPEQGEKLIDHFLTHTS